MKESLREDGSYRGGLMLCEGLVQARDEHMSQTNIAPVHYYHIGVPEHIGNSLQNLNTTKRPITNTNIPILKWWSSTRYI